LNGENDIKNYEVNKIIVHIPIYFTQFVIYLTRGNTFREDYLEVRRMHSLLDNPIVIMLTATATEIMRKDIIKKMNMDVSMFKTFAQVPDR
jgi:hypothetical protein